MKLKQEESNIAPYLKVLLSSNNSSEYIDYSWWKSCLVYKQVYTPKWESKFS